MMMPAGGTTLTTFVSGFGVPSTNVGTAANPPTSTSLLTSTRRATFTTANTAGSLASHRQSTLQVYGAATPRPQWVLYTIRFGTSTLGTGNRAFIGLSLTLWQRQRNVDRLPVVPLVDLVLQSTVILATGNG